jgi:cell division protein FtsQ
MQKKLAVIKWLCIVIFSIAIIFFAKRGLINFMHTSPYFNLREINISGERYVTENNILLLSNFSIGENIFMLDIKSAAKRIQSHSLIRDAVIIRRLPDRIDILVKERNQIAYIVLGLTLYGMDDEGYILPVVDENLVFPTVTGLRFSKANIGERLNLTGVRSAINVIHGIRAAKLDGYADVTEINVVKPANPVLFTRDKTEIRLGNSPLHRQFDSLKRVLINLKTKGVSAEYIDLRFGESHIPTKERKQ